MRGPTIALLFGLGLLVLPSCAARPPHLCPDAAGCETGSACVVGRCRPADAPPSAPDTTRVLLDPADLAVIASGASAASGGEGGGGEALPESVALGRASNGTVVVLMRFVATWKDDADVVSAFLLLEPLEGAAPARTPLTLETARILEPWSSANVSWGRQPRLGLPEAAGSARPRPALPVRVDVTSLVRDWAKRDPSEHGIALLASGHDAVGTAYSTGVSAGAGPRLEVYVR